VAVITINDYKAADMIIGNVSAVTEIG